MKKLLCLLLVGVSCTLYSQTTTPFTINFDDGTFQDWVSDDPNNWSSMSVASTNPHSPGYHVSYYSSISKAGIRLADVQSPGMLSFRACLAGAYSGTPPGLI